MLYNNIAIEGNIGAGKTTLARFLSKELKTALLLEEFEENEFLKEFYQNNSFAIHAELQFILHRSKQMHHFYEPNPDVVISDYMPLKSQLFAKQNLVTKDYMLIKNLINELLTQYPQPEIVIFLNRSVYELKENIAKRGRNMEAEISTDYLLKINKAYNEFLNQDHMIPVLMINAKEIDFTEPEKLKLQFQNIFNHKFSPGVQNIFVKDF